VEKTRGSKAFCQTEPTNEKTREFTRRRVQMKNLVWLLLLVGCTNGQGVFKGKVIDVSWEGRFIKTCEVDFQYGDMSSNFERFSSQEPGYCDQLEKLVGETVTIKYDRTAFKCFGCVSSDLIRQVVINP
jgi:hypothetical protein